MSPKRRILVVDDDPVIRDFLGSLLSSWHCEVIPASSGPEALELLRNRPVDVVLLDLAMPVMDGAETLHEIRRRTPDLPVIMMSLPVTPGEKRRLCEAGARGFVRKPVKKDTLAIALFPYVYPSA